MDTKQSFKGGLADNSEQTTKLHTATHLLHKALREVLGDHVAQKGSNITPERLRFDFSHPEKMTPEQIAEVERIVNEQINADLPVSYETMTLEEARQNGAVALFGDKYDEVVKVYSIGDFSKEVCGGPHVEHTGELGSFKITKEQSSSQGVRRIKAVVGDGSENRNN
jgi:alanyl-tRNA synthetase